MIASALVSWRSLPEGHIWYCKSEQKTEYLAINSKIKYVDLQRRKNLALKKEGLRAAWENTLLQCYVELAS